MKYLIWLSKNKTLFFDVLFLIIIVILIIMSSLAILIIHWNLFDKTKWFFSFTPSGINNYLASFGGYKTLFTATIATIAAYFGLLRHKAATDANNDKLKQDRFSEWKAVLEIRFIESEKLNPYMQKEFIKIRYNLFLKLYELKFKIENISQLSEIFENHFSYQMISFIEKQHIMYLKAGGTYPSNEFSFTMYDFYKLFRNCVDYVYSEIMVDFEALYLAALPADRKIDPKLYDVGINGFVALK